MSKESENDYLDDINNLPDDKEEKIIREQLLNDHLEADLDIKVKKFELASKYYPQICLSIIIYLVIILLIVVLSSLSASFNIKDTVLITLLSTTTANIIGVLYIASRWLFPSDCNPKTSNPKRL